MKEWDYLEWEALVTRRKRLESHYSETLMTQ